LMCGFFDVRMSGYADGWMGGCADGLDVRMGWMCGCADGLYRPKISCQLKNRISIS